MKGIVGIAIIMTILTILVTIGLSVGDMVGPGYEFNYNVHSHMENAYYANQPELMKSELLKAVDGMEDLGLTEDLYGAFWSWDKTPNRRMDFQYKHMSSIIDRVDSVIAWRNEVYGNNSGASETLGDVYEQKMDNLRGFLKEDGWSDWIAKDAYYVNHALIYYFSWYIIMILLFITAILWISVDVHLI